MIGLMKSRWRSAEEPEVGWLVRDGDVLASVELVVGPRARATGLLGRDGIDGAMYIDRCRSVHTVTLGFELDVAFLDADMTVVRSMRLGRNRVTLPVWRARSVIEAEAGAFGRWELKVGDVLEIRPAEGACPDTGDDSVATGDAGDDSVDTSGETSADAEGEAG